LVRLSSKKKYSAELVVYRLGRLLTDKAVVIYMLPYN
jgi:hypothetical protein